MTETERLVKEGVFDSSFFQEEMKNEFLIDVIRKKIWAIEIDLLMQLGKVCNKHGIRYFLMFGSLLGAIRHEGFIPWDDDIDVVVPRKDYEVLIGLKDEFLYPYFLQTPYTDKGFYNAHAKLRNSNTSAIALPFVYESFNMGISIDIFPMDEINDEDGGEKLYSTISDLIMENSVAMRISNPNLNERDRIRVKNYKGGDPLKRCDEISRLSQRDYGKNAEKVSVFAMNAYDFKRDLFFKEDFSESVFCHFCGKSFPIPIGYNRILKTTYGDYMKFPPVEERGNWHGNIVFDPNVPYNKKIKELR